MNDSVQTVAVFGANGPTGQLLTSQLLEVGHAVIAVTRHPDNFPLTASGLTVVRADATNPGQVALAIRGSQAVVSVLGTKYSKEPITLYSDSACTIIDAMRTQGIRRIIVTSSMAAVDWPDPHLSWFERVLVRRVLSRIGATLYQDMRRMEGIVSASELDWTIMRPLGLASMDPPTEYAIAGDHIAGKQTARRDLAAAIADQVDRTDYLRTAVAVATINKTVSVAATIWREGIKPKLRPNGN